MIYRLNKNNVIDLIEFFNRVPDKFEEMYVTINNERKFLKGDWHLIKKLLNTQEIYAIYDKGIKGLMMVYKAKNYRPYIKFLNESRKSESSLIKYLIMNFSEQDLFIKLKKVNPLAKYIKYFGFIIVGDRGQETLLFRKGVKILHKQTPKDLLLGDNEERLY